MLRGVTGAHPVRYYVSNRVGMKFRPALGSPFTRDQRRISTVSGSLSEDCTVLLFFVVGFDVCIIAQSVPLVNSFLQLSVHHPAYFFPTLSQKPIADPKVGYW